MRSLCQRIRTKTQLKTAYVNTHWRQAICMSVLSEKVSKKASSRETCFYQAREKSLWRTISNSKGFKLKHNLKQCMTTHTGDRPVLSEKVSKKASSRETCFYQAREKSLWRTISNWKYLNYLGCDAPKHFLDGRRAFEEQSVTENIWIIWDAMWQNIS